jgi:hypothetical protein
MNTINKSYCCWINPNWINEEIFQYKKENPDQYLLLKDKIKSRWANFQNGESFEQLRGCLKDYTFFPVSVSRIIRMVDNDQQLEPDYEYNLIGLLYLTKFENENDIYPFTVEQEKVIQKSSQTNKAACCWLHLGGTLSIISVLLAGISPQYWSSIPGCVSQTSGCLATGKYPDLSSIADNTRQNIYHDEIQNMYQNMGHELVMLKEKDPDLAHNIATHLKLDKIRESILKNLWSSGADCLLQPLKEARDYVLYGTIPPGVVNLRQAVEIAALKREIAALKKGKDDI